MLILQSTLFCLLGLKIFNLHIKLEHSNLLQSSFVNEISVTVRFEHLYIVNFLCDSVLVCDHESN